MVQAAGQDYIYVVAIQSLDCDIKTGATVKS